MDAGLEVGRGDFTVLDLDLPVADALINQPAGQYRQAFPAAIVGGTADWHIHALFGVRAVSLGLGA